MPVPVLATVVLLALACVCAGCGERSDDAAAVVERFQTALEGRDGAGACAELSERTARALYVTSAAVSPLDGDTLFLDEASDGWEISAAGCRPSAPDRPFDCELEG